MRRIAVLTSSRAEYGLLRFVLRRLLDEPDVDLQLVVTGTHLASEHGETWREIEADGIPIAARIEMGLEGDRPDYLASALGRLSAGLGEFFARSRPELLVLLGDRFELLAAAQAALVAGVPIAHIHGGEITEGAFDDAVRHAVTKLSHLHLVATEEFAHRVRQMGEEPWRVHVVGALGVDAVRELPVIPREELSASLGFDLGHAFALVTYHPETLSTQSARLQIDELLTALDAHADLNVVITGPNTDPGGSDMRERIREWVSGQPDRCLFVASLGQHRYLSAMRHAAVVVGNSSSGIIEAPTAGTPTVNIGRRQAGRPRAASVFDCEARAATITAAVVAACRLNVSEAMSAVVNPYGRHGAAAAAVTQVLRADHPRLIHKRFIDVAPIGRDATAAEPGQPSVLRNSP